MITRGDHSKTALADQFNLPYLSHAMRPSCSAWWIQKLRVITPRCRKHLNVQRFQRLMPHLFSKHWSCWLQVKSCDINSSPPTRAPLGQSVWFNKLCVFAIPAKLVASYFWTWTKEDFISRTEMIWQKTETQRCWIYKQHRLNCKKLSELSNFRRETNNLKTRAAL